MCQVERSHVIGVHNVETTYHVPMLLEDQHFIDRVVKLLELKPMERPIARQEQGHRIWRHWVDLAQTQAHHLDTVSIVLVGKYTSLKDSYMSVCKALEHAAMHCRKKLELVWVAAEHLEPEAKEQEPTKYYKAWHALSTAKGGKSGLYGTLTTI